MIDEAAFHEDLPGLLKAALAFTMWGGLVRIISTHNGAHSAFNELVNEIRAGRRPYSLHRTTFDDALADGLYKKICEQSENEWSEAEAARMASADCRLLRRQRRRRIVLYPARVVGRVPELGADRSADESRRFRSCDGRCRRNSSSRPEAQRYSETQAWCDDNIAPVLAALDPALASCFGEDFGRSGDLTVIWPLQIGQDLTRRTPFVVELRNIPFRNQEQVLFYIVDRLPRFIGGAMDARGNGQYLAETAAQRYGARIVQVMLSEGWYRENMPRYKAAFEDGTIEIPKDADVLADHRAIVLENGVAKISRPTRAAATAKDGMATRRWRQRSRSSRRAQKREASRTLPARVMGSGSNRVERQSVRVRTDGG